MCNDRLSFLGVSNGVCVEGLWSTYSVAPAWIIFDHVLRWSTAIRQAYAAGLRHRVRPGMQNSTHTAEDGNESCS